MTIDDFVDNAKSIRNKFFENTEYEFECLDYLCQAITHKSMGSPNQELLEFRGDSVLDFILTEWVLNQYPNETEGFFGKLWDRMARAENFANIARKLGFHDLVMKKENVKITDQILADTLEAVVGAIYLDGGLPAAKQFILKHCTAIPEDTDYKTQLQEKTQKFGYTPVYETIQNSGKGNRLVFTARVRVPIRGENTYPIPYFGEGSTKKAAEQSAAKQALEVL